MLSAILTDFISIQWVMQSLQSKLIIRLIRNRNLFQFKLKPEVVDENFSVEEFRRSIDRASAKVKLPKSVTTEEESVYGMKAEWIIPQHPAEDKVLL